MKKFNHVLLVEDNEIDIFVTLKLFKVFDIGFNISICTNGQEAIHSIEQYHKEYNSLPDLIILDLQLPIMNGFEFIRKLNEFKFFKPEATQIIILTACLIDQSEIATLQSLGIKNILSKPLDITELENLKAEKNFESKELFSS